MERRNRRNRDYDRELAEHRRIQEDLTEELLGYSAHLKDGSLQIAEELGKGNAILDDTTSLQKKNLDNVKKETEDVGNLGTRTLYQTLLTYGLVVIVGCIFVAVFWFIRLNPV